jgi:hypothetical protein
MPVEELNRPMLGSFPDPYFTIKVMESVAKLLSALLREHVVAYRYAAIPPNRQLCQFGDEMFWQWPDD